MLLLPSKCKAAKSAGSFAPMLSYYYTEIDASDVPELNGVVSYFANIALAPAYYYNWVIAKNFLVSGGLSIGGGVTVNTAEGKSTTLGMVQASGLMSLGYNSDRFYCGVNNKTLVASHEETSNIPWRHRNYTSFFVGYRLMHLLF